MGSSLIDRGSTVLYILITLFDCQHPVWLFLIYDIILITCLINDIIVYFIILIFGVSDDSYPSCHHHGQSVILIN